MGDKMVTEVYAGAKWLQEILTKKGITLSPLGVKVANILGRVNYGLYHLKWASLSHQRTDWTNKRYIEIVLNTDLSTYDWSDLTQYVVYAHDERLRLGINAKAPHYLCLVFSPLDDDYPNRKIPTLEEAIEWARGIKAE
jgi:hypothetical protein